MHGIRSFNVNPGFVATERVVAAGAQLDFVAKHGMSPAIIGTAIADLIDDPAVTNGGYVQALDRAIALGLVETSASGVRWRHDLRDRADEHRGAAAGPAGGGIRYTVISVDDHVVEPAHLFRPYLPQKLQAGGAADRRDRATAPRSGSSKGRSSARSA